jgi:hypothetical protein
MAFFVTKGKRSMAEHLMGRPDEAPPDDRVSRDEVVALVDDLVADLDAARREALIEETARLTGATAEAEAGGEVEEVPGLMGRTDERGLDARAHDLLTSGTVSVVAFGHTHAPVDRIVQLPRRIGRVFNTGGWIPQIAVAPRTTPSLAELLAAQRAHDLRYLVLELGGEPRAALERLTPGR